jgi:hypothetical protein
MNKVLPFMYEICHRRFFSYELLNVQSQENYYRQATYEDEVPTFSKLSAVLVVQETDCLNAYIAIRFAYDEHIEVCPRGT